MLLGIGWGTGKKPCIVVSESLLVEHMIDESEKLLSHIVHVKTICNDVDYS